MEMVAFVLILTVSNMNDPAIRAAADASAHQLNLDKMVTNYVENRIPQEHKGQLKIIYGINDIMFNRRLTLNWSF